MPSPRPLERVLVTGGCGFIGSTVLRRLLARPGASVLNYDALTYAGLPESVAEIDRDPRYEFVRGDVSDAGTLGDAVARFRPGTLVHLAAESHVDRSIVEPDRFVRTNVEGTAAVLRVWRDYRDRLPGADADHLRLVHVSTDEVYGPVEAGEPIAEGAPYAPSSPYSASKAAADHLVRAYERTYGVEASIVCPTNNYGPRQFPEKLVPLATLRAVRGEAIPLYGDGQQVRDWLHVADCAAGIEAVAERGRAGETYHLGAASGDEPCDEWNNRRVVEAIANAVDAVRPEGAPRCGLIQLVEDRPGHDRRYALDSTKARTELGWRPQTGFDEGLATTVQWCLDNPNWIAAAEARA